VVDPAAVIVEKSRGKNTAVAADIPASLAYCTAKQLFAGTQARAEADADGGDCRHPRVQRSCPERCR